MRTMALQVAVLRRRVGHEAVAVEGGDGLGVGDARRDDFAAAGIASHEMGFHQSGGDPEVGFDEAPVQPHRGAVWRAAEVDVVLVVACVVVLHAHGLAYPGVADEFVQLRTEVRPMQAGGDEDHDVLARDACVEQSADDGGQQQPVGHRAGDVADQDAGRAPAADQRRQRSAADRVGKGGGHARRRVGQHRHGGLAYHRDACPGRQRHRDVATTVTQFDLHGLYPRERTCDGAGL
jgi:hypothetical protein